MEKQPGATDSPIRPFARPQDLKLDNELPMHHQILDVRQPVAQFVINSFLQAAAFAVAIAFGVFAVKSVDVANLALYVPVRISIL